MVPGKATFVSDEAASLPVKPVSWGGHLSKFWCRYLFFLIHRFSVYINTETLEKDAP